MSAIHNGIMFRRLRNNCIWVESLCMEAYSQFNNGMKFRWFGDAHGCEHSWRWCNEKRESSLITASSHFSQQEDHNKLSHAVRFLSTNLQTTKTIMNLKSGVIVLTCIIAGTSSQPHSASRGSSDAIESKSMRTIHITKMYKFTSKVGRCYCLLFVRVSTHSRRSTQPSFFAPLPSR